MHLVQFAITVQSRELSKEFLRCAGSSAILVSKNSSWLNCHLSHFGKIIHKSHWILLSVSIPFFSPFLFVDVTRTHSSETETKVMISVGMRVSLFNQSDLFLNISHFITDSEIDPSTYSKFRASPEFGILGYLYVLLLWW